jgi:hypothetical protein
MAQSLAGACDAKGRLAPERRREADRLVALVEHDLA